MCWLLDWANPEYKKTNIKLHIFALSFLESIILKFSSSLKIEDIVKIKIFKQKYNIDVYLEITTQDELYLLLIENKVASSFHNNQLERYAILLSNLYENYNQTQTLKFHQNNLFCLYYKTIEHAQTHMVIENKYQVFSRQDFLYLCENYQKFEDIQSDILLDYYDYLGNIDKQINSYKTLKPSQIENSYSWIGFLDALNLQLKSHNWDYVPNASGGFWGYFGDFNTIDNFNETLFGHPYYQLECNKGVLQIRVEFSNQERKKKYELRKTWLIFLQSIEPKFKKPTRYGSINSNGMAVAEMKILKEDVYLGNQIDSVANTIKVLSNYKLNDADFKKHL